MLCKSCGTEIAEKAIVCYRCGTATTDPVRRPAAIKPKRSNLLWVVIAVVLTLAGLALGQMSRTAADPEPLQLAAGLAVGLAVAVLLLTVFRRR
jgi:hypothetical protein